MKETQIHMPFDPIKANDVAPTRASIHVVAGPPGMGKSWFCGTVAEVVPPEEVLLLATLPREVRSVQYQRHNLDTLIIQDEAWEPENNLYQATGCNKLIKVLKELRTDDKYSAIILDSGTEAGELAWHAALAPFKVGDPSEMGRENRFSPYTKCGELMEQVVRSLSKLAGHPSGGRNDVVRPKFVLVTMHIQPPKEGLGADESADQKGGGVEYEGSVLPMLRGRFRRRLAGLVDGFVYADRVPDRTSTGRIQVSHKIQVRSDLERHAKFPGLLPDGVTHVDNNFKKYIELVDRSLANLQGT